MTTLLDRAEELERRALAWVDELYPRHPLHSSDYPGSPRRAPLYLTGCTNPPTRVAGWAEPRLGMLTQPGNSIHLQGRHFTHWAVDNGVYGVAMQTYLGLREPWNDEDTEAYLDYLARVVREADISKVLFATAPDVLTFIDNPDPELAALKKKPIPIGDAEATWYLSHEIFPEIRRLGFQVALVAQDGINEVMPCYKKQWDEFDALFLGGSDHFKLGREAECITNSAWRYGKWVHMGRVNSLKRIQIAHKMGCDSVDGTYIGFAPKKNLPRVLGWLVQTRPTEFSPTIPSERVPAAA